MTRLAFSPDIILPISKVAFPSTCLHTLYAESTCKQEVEVRKKEGTKVPGCDRSRVSPHFSAASRRYHLIHLPKPVIDLRTSPACLLRQHECHCCPPRPQLGWVPRAWRKMPPSPSRMKSNFGWVSRLAGKCHLPILISATELDNVLRTPCETHEHIDDALRSFLTLTTQFKRASTSPSCRYE
jgi:hypothetical protein